MVLGVDFHKPDTVVMRGKSYFPATFTVISPRFEVLEFVKLQITMIGVKLIPLK